MTFFHSLSMHSSQYFSLKLLLNQIILFPEKQKTQIQKIRQTLGNEIFKRIY